MSKRYLYGLDVSMSCTGIAIIDMDTLEPVLVTSITTSDKDEYGERLNQQRVYLKEIGTQYPPTEVYFERGFTRFNTATQVIFRVVGVLNELLRNYPQEYLTPGAIKKTLTGNGRCSKTELQEELSKRYPQIDFENEDESDAVGVAYCALVQKHKMKW